jgi:hypothetical protein
MHRKSRLKAASAINGCIQRSRRQRILLTLLEESSDGFEYLDDSNGELGDLLSGLGATPAEVIPSLVLDEDEREDILSDLDDLRDQLGDYGVEGLSVAARHGWEELPDETRRDEAHGGYKDEDEDFDSKGPSPDWEICEKLFGRSELA